MLTTVEGLSFDGRIRALELWESEDGFKYVISLSSNGVFKMWELASPKLLRSHFFSQRYILSVCCCKGLCKSIKWT